MSYIRRTLALSAGMTAGVCTAPYLCPTHRTPTEPSAAYRSYPAHRSESGFNGGRCGTNSAEGDIIDTATEQASLVCVGEALSALYCRAHNLLDTATQVMAKGTAMAASAAAAAVAGAHGVANAATFEASQTSPGCGDATVVQFDDHPRPITKEANGVTDSTTDARVELSAHTQSDLHKRTEAFRAASHKLKDRFMYYARRDPATGKFVLSLEGFVRCMLLLPDDGGVDAWWCRGQYSGVADDSAVTTEESSSRDFPYTAATADNLFLANAVSCRRQSRRSAPLQQQQGLPSALQQRFADFFQSVDLDGTNSIDYAEFVVLFTFLSTPQEALKRAFRVFDLDGNGRLHEWEFCRLLNTIMVDPAVQVHYTAVATDAGGSEVNGAAKPEGPAAAISAASTSHASTANRASVSRRGEWLWRRHRDALTFDLGSELIHPLLFGPLPPHVGAPPGSTHHDHELALPTSLFSVQAVPDTTATVRSTTNSADQAVVSSTRPLSAPPVLGESVWWRRSCHSLQHLFGKVWPLQSSNHTRPSCDPEFRALHFPAITAPAATSAPATLSNMFHLQKMAEEDSQLQMVSYPTFLYRLDYLRWELRAIEFGLCDPANTGAISLDDCCRLLRGHLYSAPERKHRVHQHPDAIPVTWQLYQKLFDVVKESDRIMGALQLALDAMPPVPEEMLRGGAIPDKMLEAATRAIPDMVRLHVVHHASTTTKGEGVASGGVSASHHHGSGAAGPIFSDGADVTEANSADGDHLREGAAARQEKPSLVRPTALTWDQFNRVLNTLGAVAPLPGAEASLFRALFDEDGSDSLSPAEFARVCAIKERFFAQKLPRFDEPKRNTVQQFFHCMQQLD
ncbi:hypothetical protein JKF63_04413 [Porcisia hertigi]|uniref:EF-hand domain-containing protein n=1 Tax=Porcisia hertigi TaxID=2761500 RepID=A0A836LAE7_9TRYP|nr:hypothetical protein JKF63_04413 [Porcisia hertigi]